jgi:hypothetical protein
MALEGNSPAKNFNNSKTFDLCFFANIFVFIVGSDSEIKK